MRIPGLYLCLLGALTFPAGPLARIRFVSPGQNIQSAINATTSFGDTLILEDGHYYEHNLRFGAKGLIFGSRFILDGDPSHTDRCIIDGGNSTDQFGSVLFIDVGLGSSARFAGFTITGGAGSDVPGVMTGGKYGGGIYAFIQETSHLHMERVNVIGNTADHYPGILSDMRTTMINCVISDNRVPGSKTFTSSALYLVARSSNCIDVDLRGCVITDNHYYGLGIEGCDNMSLSLKNCIIAGNGFGALIKRRNINANLTNCLLTGNKEGGIILDDQTGNAPMTLTVKNSMLLDPIRTYSGVLGNLVATDSWFGTIHSTFTTVDTARCRMDASPMFVDSAQGDYHLLTGSAAVDGGNPLDDFSLEPDCGGTNTAIDIGAYGNTPEATCKTPGSHMQAAPPAFVKSLFIGELAKDIIIITNTGTDSMFVRSCAEVHIPDSDLSCEGVSPVHTKVPPGGSAGIFLRYQAAAARTALIPVTVNFPADNSGLMVPYSVTVENGNYDQIFTNLWDFGSIAVGTTAFREFHLKNLGHNPIQVTELSVSSVEFFLIAPAPFTLSPGDSLAITAAFVPSAAGEFQARIRLVSPDIETVDSTLVLHSTGLDSGVGVTAPARLEMPRNAPNPFSAVNHLTIGLPEASRLDLSVHDIAGIRVKSLHAGALPAGNHRFAWDGRNDGGGLLPSGVYYYRVSTRTGAMVRKVILAR